MKIVLTRNEVIAVLKRAIWEKYDDAFIPDYELRKGVDSKSVHEAIEIVNECSVLLTTDDWEFSLQDQFITGHKPEGE